MAQLKTTKQQEQTITDSQISIGKYKAHKKLFRVDQVKDDEVYFVMWDDNSLRYSRGLPSRVSISEWKKNMQNVKVLPEPEPLDESKLDLEFIKSGFWKDKITGTIFWNTESYDIEGPYDTLEEAEHDCETYCREILGVRN